MKLSINKNLISLKCVMFAFFAGVGCLLPWLPAHALATGLSRDEARVVGIVAPLVALLGPLIAGPLADRLSVGRGATGGAGAAPGASGRILRYMLVACLALSILFYGLLLAVPTVNRQEARRPFVSFSCHEQGAMVLQEKCSEENTCNYWDGEKVGSLLLSSCHYSCEDPLSSISEDYAAADFLMRLHNSTDMDEDEETSTRAPAAEGSRRRRRHLPRRVPHLCHDTHKGRECQVFSEDTKQLSVEAHLLTGNQFNDSDVQWCTYPLAGFFQCTMDEDMIRELTPESGECQPHVRCRVDDPYDARGSVLAESQCMQLQGDPDATFWTYLVLRSVADIFPSAALGLLGTACVIATRETSLGRGDVGRQLAFGALALAVLPPLAGLAADNSGSDVQPYLAPFLMFIASTLVAAGILLADNNMPLSPPEWWWHTANGMLALPMSAVRRYGSELAAVTLVLALLGAFWAALDTYYPWMLLDFGSFNTTLGLSVTYGAIPAVLVLWWAERVVDYCGHSNLFIAAFTVYILRFTGMSLLEDSSYLAAVQVLEALSLALAWVAGVLYMRHLVPRKYTSTGQALPVLAHFCIGRFIGAVVGGVCAGGHWPNVRALWCALAAAAGLLAAAYLALYHLLLAPRCRAPANLPPDPSSLQGLNSNGRSNGVYTPLRIYHNERARKGQFRY